jgi:hypothetical protein
MESIKICVLSDSHGNSEHMSRAISVERPNYIIFLGDGELDFEVIKKAYPNVHTIQVRGNCDIHSPVPAIQKMVVGGKKFFATHGHKFNVKHDLTFWELRHTAMEDDADIVLFGHTHTPFKDRSLGMEILNPGSISNSKNPSYGVVTISEGKIATQIKYLN